MAGKLGVEGCLYYLSTGSRATWGTADAGGIHEGAAPANLSLVDNVRDLSINLEKGEADVTTRGGNGFRQRKATLKDGSIEFQMVYLPGDTAFDAFMASWLNNTPIACAVLDGESDTADVEGLWADFEVFNFSKTENLEEAQMVTVSIKPTISTVAPEWVRVTAGGGGGT